MVGRFMSSFVDADTGELWEGAEEVEGIRRVLNYRQCHITRHADGRLRCVLERNYLFAARPEDGE